MQVKLDNCTIGILSVGWILHYYVRPFLVRASHQIVKKKGNYIFLQSAQVKTFGKCKSFWEPCVCVMNGIFRYVFELIFTWFPVNTDFFLGNQKYIKGAQRRKCSSYIILSHSALIMEKKVQNNKICKQQDFSQLKSVPRTF